MCRKLGDCCAPFLGGELCPYLTQCRLGEAYLRTKWHLIPSSRFATTDMGRKLGAVPLIGGAGSSSNTMWPGPRPTSVPSFILIHPAVWLQNTNVTDRQTGQDRTDRHSIGRTVLQTVAQKWMCMLINLTDFQCHSFKISVSHPLPYDI